MSDISLNLVLQDFDFNDPINIGRPRYFNPAMYLSIVEQMIVADEVERAFWMLDNMPAWYRDNKPIRAIEIKDQLLKRLYTSYDYFKAESEIEINNLTLASKEDINLILNNLLRSRIMSKLCQELNDKGIVPHITELAPGNYWLPIGLKHNQIEFTYNSMSLDQESKSVIKKYLRETYSENSRNAVQIFVCFELIEHLRFEAEIYQHYLKEGRYFSHILLSTPKYTVNTAQASWYTSDLGHLRAYTPTEFGQFAMKYWPNFNWEIAADDNMVLLGKRI